MSELKPTRIKRYRAMIGAYHVELENLMRTLAALEQAGLKTHSLKRVTTVHDRLEKYLEQIEAGQFDSRALARMVALFNEGYFQGFGEEDAFENASGAAVQQMNKTEKRWRRLHDFIFGGDKGPDDEEDWTDADAAEAERETTALYEGD